MTHTHTRARHKLIRSAPPSGYKESPDCSVHVTHANAGTRACVGARGRGQHCAPQSLPSTGPQAPASCLFTAGIRTVRTIFRLFLHRLWGLNSGPQHFRQGAILVLQVGLSNSHEYWQISIQKVVCLFVFTV